MAVVCMNVPYVFDFPPLRSAARLLLFSTIFAAASASVCVCVYACACVLLAKAVVLQFVFHCSFEESVSLTQV